MTTQPFGARLEGVALRYRRGEAPALDDLDLTIRPGVITGLLGRNGAGKSTLGALLAGWRRPSAGRVLVGPDGALENPFENTWTATGTQLVRESGDHWEGTAARDTLAYHSEVRPGWDGDLADHLAGLFGLDLGTHPENLSRGQRSALGIVVGLASRAPLTLLDESYLGLDAAHRYAFYDALLADYAEHPRTIVLSTHLIGEAERLFEDVVVLDRGKVLLAESADDVRARGVTLTGPTAEVHRAAGDRPVLARQSLGATTRVTLDGALTAAERDAARAAGLEVGGVSVQDLFVHLTGGATGATVDPEEQR
ncbi:ABC transporter ATP-binding protein [Sanguibacter sp. HDW7]|uniref:ATP-binding cassette domain-containing protein n=1 Tax=Sanguibacter sp. HDW7 TaxID=2714931 RepID=UPI00140CA146|nr:ABC transporter ATP-binding protein [Sanguibacter sp. HDW7]QIK82466.1 ABC transporter ATP-binding protein [Sanguibacter sp. HDW7]